MKLFEIVDTQYKEVNSNKIIRNLRSGNSLGSGHFSHVKSHVDPHLVNKISYKPESGYDAYVKFIANSKAAQSNPHFPRIYTASKFTGQRNPNSVNRWSGDGLSTSAQRWEMEKLKYTLNKFIEKADISTVEVVLEYHLAPELMEKYKSRRGLYGRGTEEETTIRYELIEIAEDALFCRDTLSIPDNILYKLNPDSDFAKAMRLIDQFMIDNNKTQKVKYYTDFKLDNFMIRLGPHVPQIVIIDPIYAH